MLLKTDHSYHIGEQHLRQGKPCQDYALSGNISDEIAYAIVADGCSSGGETDLGARLVALATKRALLEQVTSPALDVSNINAVRNSLIETYRKTINLAVNDMLATSLFVVATPSQVEVHLTGDGVVALQYEHDLQIEHLSWSKNAPYYPAYRLGGQDDDFLNTYGTEPNALLCQRHGLVFQGRGGVPEGAYQTYSAKQGMDGYGATYSSVGLRSVAIFSDGVEHIDGVALTSAVEELMSFKSSSGQFVTRRINRFLQNSKQLGRGALDDIAMAAIHFEPDTT